MELKKRSSLRLASAVILAGLTLVTVACGESKRHAEPGSGGHDGSGAATGGAGEGGTGTSHAAAGGSMSSASGGATPEGHAGSTAGSAVGGAAAAASGSSNATAGASGSSHADAGGAPSEGGADTGPVSGFADDFVPRARTALATAAPPWTCATTLPAVPVADGDAVRDVVRAFIADALDVAPADITMMTEACGAPTRATCADLFAHDTASTGGALYDTARPLAQELEANTTDVEVSIWTPMKDGLTLPSIFVMTGISDGTLVGLAVFNTPDVCR